MSAVLASREDCSSHLERRKHGVDDQGIMTYEKRDGRWVRVANVSTSEQQ